MPAPRKAKRLLTAPRTPEVRIPRPTPKRFYGEGIPGVDLLNTAGQAIHGTMRSLWNDQYQFSKEDEIGRAHV